MEKILNSLGRKRKGTKKSSKEGKRMKKFE
jgi:hypothetical protein